MIIHECAQNSPEWLRLRLGIPTASEFDRILTPTGKLSKQCDAYMFRLLAEWATGEPLENEIATDFMQQGHDLEPFAAKAYVFETGNEVKEVGFITTDDGMAGASPDRLLTNLNGGVEIKSPATQTHLRYMLTGEIEADYRVQVQGQCFVAELDFVDMVSYRPGFPTVVIHVDRDDKYISALSGALAEFCDGLLAARAELEKRYGPFRREPKPVDRDAMGITDEDVESIVSASFPEGMK